MDLPVSVKTGCRVCALLEGLSEQDAVPRSGKFWRLYSRPGHMAIINSMGDLIVRPSFVVWPLRPTCGRSIKPCDRIRHNTQLTHSGYVFGLAPTCMSLYAR